MSSMQVIMRMARPSGRIARNRGAEPALTTGTASRQVGTRGPDRDARGEAARGNGVSASKNLWNRAWRILVPASDARSTSVQPAPNPPDQKRRREVRRTTLRADARRLPLPLAAVIHHGGRFPRIFCGICFRKRPIMAAHIRARGFSKTWFASISGPTASAVAPTASSRPELALRVGQAAGSDLSPRRAPPPCASSARTPACPAT